MIVDDYVDGAELNQICREHGVGERRVFQILQQAGIKKRRTNRTDMKLPFSALHERIGQELYDYYFDRDYTRRQAANELGMSVQALRNIEIGRSQLQLVELQDIAAFMKISVGELLGETK